MRFVVSSVEYGEEIVDILEMFPGLKDFGYTIQSIVTHNGDKRYVAELLCVEIDSIERLIEFKNAVNEPITILDEGDNFYTIEIGSSR